MEISKTVVLFLKNDTEKNVVDKDIWVPQFLFGNMKELMSKAKEELTVKKEGQHIFNAREDLTMRETYEGSENIIKMKMHTRSNSYVSLVILIYIHLTKNFAPSI